MKLTPVADCWEIFARTVLPPDTHPAARSFIETAFTAGFAFMFDLMMANVDDEEQGHAMLTAVYEELANQSQKLADDAGIDLEVLREKIAATIRAAHETGTTS